MNIVIFFSSILPTCANYGTMNVHPGQRGGKLQEANGTFCSVLCSLSVTALYLYSLETL